MTWVGDLDKKKVRQELKLVKELAKLYGKKYIEKSRNIPDFEYNDGTTFLQLNSHELTDSELAIHNLSHFICASPLRRYLPDFGLGSSPDSRGNIHPLLPSHATNKEEDICSFLDGIIHQHLGLESKKNYNDFYKIALINWEVIDEKGNLTLKVRQEKDSEFISREEYYNNITEFNDYPEKVLIELGLKKLKPQIA